MNHEPNTRIPGSPLREYSLGPGVIGYAIQVKDEIYIPVINSLKQGNGDIGRFLDSLSKRCVVVNVCNAKLAAMLERRGWLCKWVRHENRGTVNEWRKP